MDLERLKDKLDPQKHIEWRIGRAGDTKGGGVWAVALAYITARAVHDRFDEVCGSANWQMRYKEHRNGTVCEIGVKVDGEWIWKAGGSDASDIEAYKGELSGAEKRAAVPWGVGRYLYDLTETFVETSLQKVNGWNYAKTKNGTKYWWKTPQLPNSALPAGKVPDETPSPKDEPRQSNAPITAGRNNAPAAQQVWTIEVVEAVVKAGHARDAKEAREMLNKASVIMPSYNTHHITGWTKYYREESSKNNPNPEAAADKRWTDAVNAAKGK